MAMSSITHNFVLKDKDEIERFVLAIEESMNDGHVRPEPHSASEEELKELEDLYEKWERRNKNNRV